MLARRVLEQRPCHRANPVTAAPTAQAYTGPAPANADVLAFQINLWQNIQSPTMCGGCHHAGGQSPQFARSDDINLAYEAANTVVNLQNPSAVGDGAEGLRRP